MVEEPAVPSPADAPQPDDGHTEPSLVEDVLVEEVSIDGMCGVY
jgi:mycofactocin precursor